ncbi:alpha/beta hydrolase [Streptomyces sp. DSM 44915]|uniref:Alpha/beta hydrolase n=1 Tax=Streptomyces chisholmiae TaxID=3075540 RepID=A0ABU2K0S4_9ACTN|nr:alpha/beta hydrolase [Streptomyces sp. DSM 44915]MDT0270053.1 alpha/beta hydrolase [Streptomyces sp. DSM 44915]
MTTTPGRLTRGTLALALATTALAATLAPGTAAATTPDSVRWGPCPEGVDDARLECGTLDVPLDYRDPDGRRIEIVISRLASEHPDRRRGVLVTNPGGPGGPGLDFPAVLADSGLPQEILDGYDLIGMDPRGVGHSTPVTCEMTEDQQRRGAFAPYAHTEADVAAEAPHARELAAQCADSATDWLLPHTTTANTARDLDRVRAALGEPRISYLGYSYGTQLGATYATLFPERGDRMVLDSALGADGYDVDAMRLFARGLQDRFPDFAAYAAAHPEYGLGETPEQVTATFYELADRLDADPVDGVHGTHFRGLTFELLYADATMPLLAEYWRDLDAGRPLPGELPAGRENMMAARLFFTCADSRWPTTVAAYQRNTAVDRERYPMLGGSTASIGPCAYWPTEGIEPPVRIGDDGPANLLLVQNERDPGTPLVGALDLRRALGDRATLVTADQGGHGVYLFGTNTCANEAVTTYLTTGRRPADDLACAAEPQPEPGDEPRPEARRLPLPLG